MQSSRNRRQRSQDACTNSYSAAALILNRLGPQHRVTRREKAKGQAYLDACESFPIDRATVDHHSHARTHTRKRAQGRSQRGVNTPCVDFGLGEPLMGRQADEERRAQEQGRHNPRVHCEQQRHCVPRHVGRPSLDRASARSLPRWALARLGALVAFTARTFCCYLAIVAAHTRVVRGSTPLSQAGTR